MTNKMDLFIINKGISDTKYQLDFYRNNPPTEDNGIPKKTYQADIDDCLDILSKQMSMREAIENEEFSFKTHTAQEISQRMSARVKYKVGLEI